MTKNKIIAAVALVFIAFVALLFFAPGAFAQAVAEGTDVHIPYGEILATGALAVLAVGIRIAHKAGGIWANVLLTKQVEQLLENALLYGLEKAGVGKDAKLTLDVKNELVATSLTYALNWGGKRVIEWAGGVEGIKAKIEARLTKVAAHRQADLAVAGMEPN